jgi:hypothetical protein
MHRFRRDALRPAALQRGASTSGLALLLAAAGLFAMAAINVFRG